MRRRRKAKVRTLTLVASGPAQLADRPAHLDATRRAATDTHLPVQRRRPRPAGPSTERTPVGASRGIARSRGPLSEPAHEFRGNPCLNHENCDKIVILHTAYNLDSRKTALSMSPLDERTAVLLDQHPLWLDAVERVVEGLGITVV